MRSHWVRYAIAGCVLDCMLTKFYLAFAVDIKKYPLLETWTKDKSLHELTPDILREVQGILNVDVTGVVCQSTINKFAQFKQSKYLEFPDRLGASTALSLIESVYDHPVSEQTKDVPTKVIVAAGSRTGKSVVLPGKGLVYEHEYILSNIPLTWGEMTKGLDPRRIPDSKWVVENIIAIAKVFGVARKRYGKPVAITSGYRPAHLGIGASRSQHILGKGLDSFPLATGDIRQWYNILRATPGVMGLGDAMHLSKGAFVHMDTRSEIYQVRFGY